MKTKERKEQKEKQRSGIDKNMIKGVRDKTEEINNEP